MDLSEGVPRQLGDIVALLARNAVDAMPRGGPLQISLGEQSLPSRHTGFPIRHISLAIKDYGLGMTPAMLLHVFDSVPLDHDWGSQRVARLRQARQIARLQGGKLFVDGALGYGSRVQVYLPRSGRAMPLRYHGPSARASLSS